jgi:hypothetical protein
MLQQVVLLAGACVQFLHAPVPDVQHQPRADVAVSPSFSANNLSVVIPIELELLKSRTAGGRALRDQTPIATATLKGNDVTLLAPGQAPIALTAPCAPVVAPSRR